MACAERRSRQQGIGAPQLKEPLIALSVDVEWAYPEVLSDLVRELDLRNLKATFFCTHAGVEVPGHERGLHPNFRRDGDAQRRLRARLGDAAYLEMNDEAVFDEILREALEFAPEAKGVRTHRLFYCSELLPLYQRAGLDYDSSYAFQGASHLQPVLKEAEMLELPIFFMDHLDLISQRTGFRLESLQLDSPGLKVFDFHPNIVFTNAHSEAQYLASKANYHQPDKLRQQRFPGRGARTLFLELLDYAAEHRDRCLTLGEICRRWKAGRGGAR
jgi:hypothetical protein